MQDKPLWQHQKAAIDAAASRDYYGLFFEQGTGKTRTLIEILERKCKQEGRLLPTLILCPQIVIGNWRHEILAFSAIPDSQILCLQGSGKKRAEQLNHFGGSVVITNYEALNMPEVLAALLNRRSKVLVLDESHKCKDMTAKRTKNAIALSRLAQYRYILSGTPIVNSAFDIFTQFLIMDQGRAFSSDFREFRNRYFIDGNAGRSRQSYFPDWYPKIDALEAINRLINIYCMRVKKAECLDLPPLVRQTVEVELDGAQLKAYADMARDSVAVLGSGVSSADLVIKQGLRLQQIASGFIKLDDGTVRLFDTNPKQRALRELLESIPETAKIIVWAVFKRDYDAIRKCLQDLETPFVEVHGAISEVEKSHSIHRFNDATSGIRVLIGHPASAGIGVNLTSASYSIFYSRTFSLENDLQAEARNYRGGSEIHEKVTRIDIVAKGTIDETVCAALRDKADVMEILIRKLRGNDGSVSDSAK